LQNIYLSLLNLNGKKTKQKEKTKLNKKQNKAKQKTKKGFSYFS